MPIVAWLVLDGMLAGAILAWVIAQFLPRHAHLGDALANLAPTNLLTTPTALPPSSLRSRLGSWVATNLGSARGFRAPAADLALLNISREQFYTDKVTGAILGFLAPLIVGALILVLGLPVPVALPAFVCLLMGWIFWRRPDAQVRLRAWQARRDFKAAAVAFLRLTGVMRLSQRGVKTSMELSSRLSGEWMFQRISQALYLAHYQQRPPWDAIDDLADQLQVDELHQIAVICRLGGTGGNVSSALMASATDMRRQLLAEQRRDAADTTVSLDSKVPLLVGVFVAMLMFPVLVSLLTS